MPCSSHMANNARTFVNIEQSCPLRADELQLCKIACRKQPKDAGAY